MINKSKESKSALSFFRGFLQSYVDCYHVVALCLARISEIGATIEQRTLSCELHLVIKDLYEMGIVRYMNSCLVEVIDAAFARFA